MLVEFNVQNFRSILYRQTFSLVRGKGDELLRSNTFQLELANRLNLLRSAAIYGPNASGKSNFRFALETMQEIVVNSASTIKPGELLPVTPHLLNRNARESPCEFEVSIVVDGIRYQYGFAASSKRIHEEWMLAYPKGRPQHWFSRTWNEKSNVYDWDLGNHLTGERQTWLNATRENSLFLSTAAQLNSTQLQSVYGWFKESLHVAGSGGWNPAFSASLCEKPSSKKQVLDFLQAADLNIDDVGVESKPFDVKSIDEDVPTIVREALVQNLKDKEVFEISTQHVDNEGNAIAFDIEDESNGTQKLFALAGPWIDSLENGYVLLIDELNASLHPLLVKFLVRMFHSDRTNPNNAQLIFTTHETSILDQKIFRRDQIWFCEKHEKNSTDIYPLTDFSPRKHRENLELSYLSGRYGALPHTRTPKALAHG